jgi:hypothetical protein
MRHENRTYQQSWRPREAAALADAYSIPPSPANIVQIFDQQSIATLAILYFFDNEKFSQTRLQRFFKVISLHSGTCDFVLRSLLTIVKATSTDKNAIEYIESDKPLWTGTFKVQSALNGPERALFRGVDNQGND